MSSNHQELISTNDTSYPDEISDFVNSLTVEDVGHDFFGKSDEFLVRFEGFSDQCWQDAEAKNKTVEDLETDMLEDWRQREENIKFKNIDSGWTDEPDFYTETIFWAVYKKQI